MPEACCQLVEHAAHRRPAYEAGLHAAGFSIIARPPARPRPDDVLVIWNRRGPQHQLACAYERVGAKVLIAENGYISPPGQKLYALAIGKHNGAGEWREGGAERWDQLGVPLAPWRAEGRHVLLLPQRGIGTAGVAMSPTWPRTTHLRLQQATQRPIQIRHHPGRDKTEPYEALAGAHAAVTWGSGAGIKALAAGIPVFHGFPSWIGAPAALPFGPEADLERPLLGDRLPMFRRLAWAQWSLGEIQSGEAFAWLMNL